MKYLCMRKAQYRDSSKAVHMAERGDVISTDQKVGTSFRPMEKVAEEIDFMTSSEAVLLDTTWSFNEAAKTIKTECGIDLKKTDKADIVAQIVDARFRQVD